MDVYILDLLIIGLLLLVVTLGSGLIRRLPLSYALIYLTVGIGLGPYGLKLLQIQPDYAFLERLTELVVIVSLFSCGLKMNRPLNYSAWQTTLRLIAGLMPFSIVAIALVAHYVLDFSIGAAVLLGAILAPTDPVLASEVQLKHGDQDNLRFALTSEGGLNDALAFPFVYFGLRWFESDRWTDWIVDWLRVDGIWAITAGIVMGVVVALSITWLERQFHKSQPIDALMEDFVALSLILLTYALTELVNGYGFLAVFVAGVMVARKPHSLDRKLSQLEFTEQIEKLMEVGTILILGSLLRVEPMFLYGRSTLLILGLLFFVVRPLGVWLVTLGLSKASNPNLRLPTTTRWLLGWFGIRGVGSLYYLSYALSHGLPAPQSAALIWITYLTVVASVVLHGISATPLMNWYQQSTISACIRKYPKA